MAGIILEGVVGNSGFIVPDKAFLQVPPPSRAYHTISAIITYDLGDIVGRWSGLCRSGCLHGLTAAFLQGLRALCTKHGALLVFDEVMTGFRISYGGAQKHFGITPDLSTFGKVISILIITIIIISILIITIIIISILITPGLSTFGKVIGGGLPVGAYAGKRKIMEMVAPAGPMYQARAPLHHQ